MQSSAHVACSQVVWSFIAIQHIVSVWMGSNSSSIQKIKMF